MRSACYILGEKVAFDIGRAVGRSLDAGTAGLASATVTGPGLNALQGVGGPAFVANAMNNVGTVADAAGGVASLAGRAKPFAGMAARVSPVAAGASKAMGAGVTLLDAGRSAFHNPDTGRMSLDVGKNLKANIGETRGSLETSGGGLRGALTRAGTGSVRPIATLGAVGGDLVELGRLTAKNWQQSRQMAGARR